MNIIRYLEKALKAHKTAAYFKTFISKGDLCFDLGANVGEITDVLLRIGARVVAVEPQESCLKILRRKYDGNQQVAIVGAAVGRMEKEDSLMICEETTEAATLSNIFVGTYGPASRLSYLTTEKVKVTTLERLILEHGVPHFCKIDVEGYESEVFIGLNTPIKFISFEFNILLLKDTLKCLLLLSALGDYQCNFLEYEHMKPVLPEWMEILEFRSQLYEFITEDILTGEIIVRLNVNGQ